MTPPKVLQNIVDGFDLLGAPIQAVTADPANAILAAAVDGKLTAKSLDELLTAAAAETATNSYRQEFRLKAERKFARGFQAALARRCRRSSTRRDPPTVRQRRRRTHRRTRCRRPQATPRPTPQRHRLAGRTGRMAPATRPHPPGQPARRHRRRLRAGRRLARRRRPHPARHTASPRMDRRPRTHVHRGRPRRRIERFPPAQSELAAQPLAGRHPEAGHHRRGARAVPRGR